jgi:pimeloyl-ACP methyl ester carboxylesterase
VTVTSRTSAGIAYDRAGPRGDVPVVLLHAGVADRRMWEPQWARLTAVRDAVRLDMRGFGESTRRPVGELAHVDDVLDTLAELGVGRCRLVGVSMGAGVAVEAALAGPGLVEALLLCTPGGSLIPGMTPQLAEFVAAERAALAAGDLDAAVEANVRWWGAGPGRAVDALDPAVRGLLRRMQRRAFEVTADWDDVEEREPEPSPLDRLGEITAPTLVLQGGRDLDVIREAARRVTEGIPGACRVDWPDTAHLPSLERPQAFGDLLTQWVG